MIFRILKQKVYDLMDKKLREYKASWYKGKPPNLPKGALESFT
jgi:hypothetical protein